MPESRADVEALFKSLPARRRTPVSTYRLQFHQGFGFKDAAALVPYLADLGITDVYASPILKARPGSFHGYDICDHNELNPELGTVEDFEQLSGSLRTRSMGLILDFVPNHMGIDPDTNLWWHNVLENGPSSPYAAYFDIHWDPIQPELRNKVLLPILGDQYGVVLERGEIRLGFDLGRFSIRYFDNHLPVDPKAYPRILRFDLPGLKTILAEDEPVLREFLSILTGFERLPDHTETDPDRIAERQREKTVSQERLAKLIQRSLRLHEYIDQAVKAFNGQLDDPASFDLLDQLLEAQPYRLAYWKTALHEINYRRFFDINALAGLRVENPTVFQATHELTMRLIGEGKITGLRIDHPDGLYDPAAYFESVQDMFLQKWVGSRYPDMSIEAVREWRTSERKRDPKGLAARPLYIVGEKILSQGEVLDPHWVIDGTSGYDFLNQLNGLFVDSRQLQRIRDLFRTFTGKTVTFEQVSYICKKLIMSTSLSSELNVLAHTLRQIAGRERRSRDFTWDSLRDALKEVIACFPVYRTYITSSRAGAADRQVIERAVAAAKQRNPASETSIFDFIRAVLTPENVEKVSSEEFHRQLDFTMKFQQYTGPVQAKGLEDTAFYRYNELISANEVGGSPSRFGSSVVEFHEVNAHRHAEWPYAMLATSTHDTKRGEDSRARLNVLSEMPEEWERQVRQWSSLNERFRTLSLRDPIPDRNDEYLFYQTLVGAWPAQPQLGQPPDFKKRLQEFMLKAIKEAKLHTSWIAPNQGYESGVLHFIDRVLDEKENGAFFESLSRYMDRIAYLGMINSISQLVLKIAAPGVPDFYQGSELWDLNLVDPDNRRPIDFSLRRRLLHPLLRFTQPALSRQKLPVSVGQKLPRGFEPGDDLAATWRTWRDGRIKLLMTACGLHFRRRHPELMLEGDYLPLEVTGALKEHVVAYARQFKGQVVIAVAPRLIAEIIQEENQVPIGTHTWQDTRIILPPRLASSKYVNILTSEILVCENDSLPLADLFSTCSGGWFYADLQTVT